MEFLGDFHIHSRFSRATSRDLTLPYLHAWAQRKGITVLGTGDLTHPEWMVEMQEVLVPAGEGVFRLQDGMAAEAEADVPPASRGSVRFLLTGEISNIYKQDGKTRKIHSVVFAPSFECAGRITAALSRVGNVKSDGRPILGITARNLLEIVLEAGDGAFLVPAHIWTPWFSLLGHRSGFDSLEACFGDLTHHVFAVETGLSADPLMCRRLSILDGLTLISNSDAHSGRKLGREANVFDTEVDYPSIRKALETGDEETFKGTLEFFPEEGKYHYDGHRKCNLRMNPTETRECGGLCPVCGKPITVGVMSRVEELADRDEAEASGEMAPYTMIVPLMEVLGEVLEVNPGSKRVRAQYDALIERCGPELSVLRALPLEDIERASSTLVAEAIRRMRAGELDIEAGYDGEFGTIRIFSPGDRARLVGQGTLFAQPAPVRGKRRKAPPTGSLNAAGGGEAAPDSPHRVLNEAQQAAVEAPAGPVLILAGPGTGKTRTLTHRIAHRVKTGDVQPGGVLAITFTNRAAEEMRERLGALLPDMTAFPGPVVSTFHALGLRVLREETRAAGLESGFRVLDEEDRDAMIRRALGGKASKASLTGARKNLDKEVDGFAAHPSEASELRQRYESMKADANVVDFDDLILRPLRLFQNRPDIAESWRSRFRFISVDEYQDLNPLQYELLRILAPGEGDITEGDITVIGDPDQAIYGFRGADAGFFLRFERDHPGARVVRLTRSYRSTEQIITAATQIISRSPVRWETRLWSGLQGQARISIRKAQTPRAEAEAVVHEIERLVGGTSEFSLDSDRIDVADAGRGYGFSDLAVLYRLSALRKPLEEALERSGMPFQAVGHEAAMDQPGVRDAVAALRSLKPQAGGSAAARILKRVEDRNLAECLSACARPFGDDLNAFLDHLTLGSGMDLYDPQAERIALMTLHASKGIEFPVVFIIGCEEGVLPFPGLAAGSGRKGRGPDPVHDVEEERRLLYVGMTRTKRRLYLSHARKRVLFGRSMPGKPSRFLNDIEEALKQIEASGAHPGRRRKQPEQQTLF